MIVKKGKRHPARCFTFLILNSVTMVQKKLLEPNRRKKQNQNQKENSQSASQPERNSWSLNVLLIQEFSNGGVSATTEGEDQQNESGFLRWYSPKFHTTTPRKVLIETPWDQVVWLPNQVKRTKLFLASSFTYEVATLNSRQFVNNTVTKSEADLFWAVLPWCIYLNVLKYS